MSVRTPPSKTPEYVKYTPGSNAPIRLLVVAFGSRFGRRPDAGWVVSAALFAGVFLATSTRYIIVPLFLVVLGTRLMAKGVCARSLSSEAVVRRSYELGHT